MRHRVDDPDRVCEIRRQCNRVESSPVRSRHTKTADFDDLRRRAALSQIPNARDMASADIAGQAHRNR
jgi:hypothetical protein